MIRRDIGIFDMVFGGLMQVESGKEAFYDGTHPARQNSATKHPADARRVDVVLHAQRLMSPLKGTSIDENMKSGCDKCAVAFESRLEQVDRLASFFYRPEFKRPYNAHAGRNFHHLEALIDSRGLKFRYNEGENDEDRIYTVLPCAILYNEALFTWSAINTKIFLIPTMNRSKPRHWKLSRILAMKPRIFVFVLLRNSMPRTIPTETFPLFGRRPAVRVKVQFDPSVAISSRAKAPGLNPTQSGTVPWRGMDVNPDGLFLDFEFRLIGGSHCPGSMRDRLSYEPAIRNKYVD